MYANGCHLSWEATDPLPCVFGDASSGTTIVVTGDSHSAHWFGAFEEAALANGWKLVTVTKSGCPAADVPVYSAKEAVAGQHVVYTACAQWRPKAQEYIRSLHPDLVVFPMLSRREVVSASGAASLRAWARGLLHSIRAVSQTGTRVLVMGDTPKANGSVIPSCVSSHRDDVHVCGNTRQDAVLADRLAMLSDAAASAGASWFDVSDWFCTDVFCPAVIGGQVVYRDDHHLSDGFSRLRGPEVAELVRRVLSSPSK